MRRLVVALLIGLAVATCAGHAASRQFRTALQYGDHSTPFPAVLNDETGLVTGIEPGPSDAQAQDTGPTAKADPADANAFILSWLGGGCDNDVALWFTPGQGVYALSVEMHGGGGFAGGCAGMGVPLAVRIVTSSPVPITSIVASGGT